MADDHLTPEQAAALALGGSEEPPHVLACASCRAEVASLRQVVADLRALPDPPAALLETAKAYFRRRRAIDGLIGRLIEDPALREKARGKPEAVLKEAGLEPDADLVAALRELDRPSGDLAKRIAAKAFLQ
jgi:hypothetical protein